MSTRLSHAEYKELFQQLLNREELGYETTSRWIEVELPCLQLAAVRMKVYLRGKLLTFHCSCELPVASGQKNLYLLLNELNRTYRDIKFTLTEGSVKLTLQSFILKDRMVCQCLLAMKRLADVLDVVYPQLRCALRK